MKFYEKVGFAITKEVDPINHPGMWEDVIEERYYVGETVTTTTGRWLLNQQINDDLRINNKLKILSDPFSDLNWGKIKYIWFKGVRWKVTTVEIDRPRLILTTGGEYNGEQD